MVNDAIGLPEGWGLNICQKCPLLSGKITDKKAGFVTGNIFYFVRTWHCVAVCIWVFLRLFAKNENKACKISIFCCMVNRATAPDSVF